MCVVCYNNNICKFILFILDTGATHSFIAEKDLKNSYLVYEEYPTNMRFNTLSEDLIVTLKIIIKYKWYNKIISLPFSQLFSLNAATPWILFLHNCILQVEPQVEPPGVHLGVPLTNTVM